MRTLAQALAVAVLASSIGVTPALAETPIDDGALVTVDTLGTTPEYPVLTRGQVVFVNAQRLVVTQEPIPVVKLAEAPPEPQATPVDRPAAPFDGATWVAAHWIYGPARDSRGWLAVGWRREPDTYSSRHAGRRSTISTSTSQASTCPTASTCAASSTATTTAACQRGSRHDETTARIGRWAHRRPRAPR